MPTANVAPYLAGSTYALGSIRTGPWAGGANPWASARGATSGTVDQSSTNSGTDISVRVNVGSRGNQYFIARSFIWYDLTSYTTGGLSISAITLSIAAGTNANASLNNIVCKSVNAFSSATSATLASGDFNSVYFNTTYSSTFSWSALSQLSVALNTSAVNDANSNSKLNIVILNQQYDQQNVDPSPPGSINWINSLDKVNAPKTVLQVTYAAAGYSQEVNTVQGTDIDEINTVSGADIDSVNTV